MHLFSLPDDIIGLVLGKLHRGDLHRAMSSCKRLRCVGKTASMWTFLRQNIKLPPPKKKARELKTDYDVFMQKACRSCRFNLARSFGFCDVCQSINIRVAMDFHNYKSARNRAVRLSRRIKTLQTKLDTCLREEAEANIIRQKARAVLCAL